MSNWHRDAGGTYLHDFYPTLRVRETNAVGGCPWLVERRPQVHMRGEPLGRYRTLKDAKRAVEQEGARWHQEVAR